MVSSNHQFFQIKSNMKKTLLILLACASSLFAQTKSVSPTGGGLNATDNPAFRTALGGTTVGQNLFTLTNPSAITFPRINADNTVSSLSATDFRTAIGASASFTTSAGLAGLLSDETGTGSFVLASSPTLTTPVINLGTNATGDIYYRSAGGLFTRLPIGSAGQVLSVAGGIPSWATDAGGDVTLAGSQILTNKTLSTGTVFSSPPTMTLGSDATGDVYYRNAGGLLTRLPIGSDGQFLSIAAGIPTWASGAAPDVTLSNSVTLTNKTLGSGTVITAATMTLGSDATGDIYYRNAGGLLTRLGPGSDGQVLTLASGIPSWAAAGGSLTNWTESVNTAAPNATVPAVRFLATNAATNVDAVISPKGTGAILAQVPDNTTTGGNKRGANAVDLQTSRTLATQVASGATSPTVVGGNGNTASGSNSSTVVGGSGNTASANLSSVLGGSSNTASGTWATVVGGSSNTASGTNSFVTGSANSAADYAFSSGRSNAASGAYSALPGGQNNTSSGNYSAILAGYLNTATADYATVIGGNDSDANGVYSVVSGLEADARSLRGAVVRSIGKFQNTGDNQTMNFIVRRQTTDDTPAVLTSDGSAPAATTRIAITTNSAYRFRGMLVGRTNGGVNKTVAFSGAIKQDANAASTAMIGSVTYDTLEDAGAATWVVSVGANTTDGSLDITVTGAAATTIRWSATVETIAVKY
jgi:hypothetical protein